jgi:hypothetical protein
MIARSPTLIFNTPSSQPCQAQHRTRSGLSTPQNRCKGYVWSNLDHLPDANRENKRPAAVAARIELGAIGPIAATAPGQLRNPPTDKQRADGKGQHSIAINSHAKRASE